ncbi:MAG: hypothetical protein LCI02_20895 [Proteobacteria bacterium]|nr:hypothetical protein [Pseudomonadota bacterium]
MSSVLDAARLERAGVPTAAVITTAFVREADYQADTSGMLNFKPIVVPHPTSHLPEDQIKALATTIVPEVLDRLLQRPD